jgi:hypothetical protein
MGVGHWLDSGTEDRIVAAVSRFLKWFSPPVEGGRRWFLTGQTAVEWVANAVGEGGGETAADYGWLLRAKADGVERCD